MKKIVRLLSLLFVVSTLAGCNGNNNPTPNPNPTPIEETISVTSISLSESTKSLAVGEHFTLVPTVLPSDATNKNVRWNSTNPSVAKVEDGVVTALAEGQTNILVTTIDGGFIATCVVNVSIPVIHVDSVSLNKTSLTLEAGDSETLIATVLPADATNNNVIWTSTNSDVATVNNGTVMAHKKGNATIVVSTVDGNKTATCEVTVTRTITPAEEPVEIVNEIDQYFTKEVFESYSHTLNYRKYVPESFSNGKEYSLLIYFHDEDGKGNDNESQISNHDKTVYLEKILNSSLKDDVIIIAPQCPTGENFTNVENNKIVGQTTTSMLLVGALIMDLLTENQNIDVSRVLATGVGSGATAVFDLIKTSRGLVAGAVTVDGTANVEDYEDYALTPIWSFYSSNSTQGNTELKKVTEKLKSVGAGILTKEYEGIKDKAYIPAYQNENAFEWLMSQKRVNEYYYRVDGSYSNLSTKGTAIVSNTNPRGIGNKDLGTISNGRASLSGSESLNERANLQYDTYGVLNEREDYFGYTFSKEYEFNKLVFQSGHYFMNSGGWFSGGVKIQVKDNGVWVDVSSTASPAYPVVESIQNIDGINYPGFEIYEFTFEPVTTDGIRILGNAGGREFFSSCAELEVYGREPNLSEEGSLMYKEPSEFYSDEEIVDKITGGWVGQMSGVVWGAPTEFSYRGQLIPKNEVPDLETININAAFTQDDLYVEIPFIEALMEEGIDVSIETMGEYFKNTAFPLWHGNDVARTNLLNGIKAPECGSYVYSSCCEDIDWQIEADFVGLMTPGLVNEAMRLGFDYGHVIGYADGAYGGVFVDAMHSKAYTAESVTSVAVTGVESLPKGSKYRSLVDDVLDCYINDYSFEQCFDKINELWEGDDRCPREGFGPSAKFNIDAKYAGGSCLMGLLYGKNDFKEMTELSMRCGQDSDCNPSTVASILGGLYGYKKMPEAFKRGVDFNSSLFSYTDFSLNKSINSTKNLAKQFLAKNGNPVENEIWHLNKNETINQIELEVWEDMPSFEQIIVQNGLYVKVNVSAYYSKGIKGISVDFGDGYQEIGESTNHTYSEPGEYSLTIKVYGNDNTFAEREFIMYIIKDQNIAGQGTAICSQSNPSGAGSRSLDVIIDGVLGRTASQQYDTFYSMTAPAHDDYFGLQFENQVTVNKVEYYAGSYFDNGGWFENIKIQKWDGSTWTDVTVTNDPGYPNARSRQDAGKEYEKYVFEFDPITCRGIRIIGAAGGSSHFVGCSELKVFSAE